MVTRAFRNFEEKLQDLEKTVNDCNNILISDMPSSFIYENANFLTKSFMISLCGYLETYLKDVLEVFINDYNERILNLNIPYNLIKWSLDNKDKPDSKIQSLLDKNKIKYEDLYIKIKKKDLDAFISGNPFRTKELFTMFGLNLDSLNFFIEKKDLINQIVIKRNNILHHNDDASDLSNLDIIQFLDEIKNYCFNLDNQIESRILNRQQCI